MTTKPENRPRIFFDAAKIDPKRKPYADTIREALCYLLEHEFTEEMVKECEKYGWVKNGEWNFNGMSKNDLAKLYCTIKNILEQ